MKKLVSFLALVAIIACKKTDETTHKKTDSLEIIDSINAVRQKINDSILSHNRYKDLEGEHVLTHNMIKGQGKISFKKIGKDQYKMDGFQESGKNYIKIKGTGEMISKNNLRFHGRIEQRIQDFENGMLDVRSGKKIFYTKDDGKSFKLHDAVNQAGFPDQIYIKF
ncbi:hypothetical protein G6R40_01105 [Chryseobacterium sp. POL2]|uniref:hypothetical protein n=1 Tax=Chryseobacterium sp. POL2 TaxID=2713414 RepID=UPI0013E18CCD|nr:hypothetical protein [Chryseobacterium sp. POL2]QIG88336.1 hypothetical protein G6R40_01105 [Chryseobacterium sp. POL2]